MPSGQCSVTQMVLEHRGVTTGKTGLPEWVIYIVDSKRIQCKTLREQKTELVMYGNSLFPVLG